MEDKHIYTGGFLVDGEMLHINVIFPKGFTLTGSEFKSQIAIHFLNSPHFS